MTHRIENLALTIAIGGGILLFGAQACHQADNLNRMAQPSTTEDDPRWDCHTMGNHLCGPPTTDPYPDCGPACHSTDAEADVLRIQHTAGPEFTCWAEDNPQMPHGYEILCRHT